jgi:glycosyltransferase involved in cell wall biosynthesis
MTSSFSRISVVMTAYNSERYIGPAIESILNQTFHDFEFIIVDDGSSDETDKIVRSYNDKRIVYTKNEKNLGQTKSLNIGIKLSRGKYIARMDADDISHSRRLQTQFDYLEKHNDVSILGSWAEYIDYNNKKIRNFKTPTDPLEIRAYLAGSGD